MRKDTHTIAAAAELANLRYLAATVVATLMLLVPAIWNGFALLEFDTGGYIARWYEGTLEESRSTVYGLFLNALTWPDFWPVVLVQAMLTVWTIALVLRVHGFAANARALLVTVALLTVLTGLPWLTSILLTDIFSGLSVLALYLVLLRPADLARWEIGGLCLLIAFSAATHSATLLVLMALWATAVVVALFDRRARSRLVSSAAIARGAAALVLGAVLLVAANYAVAGRIAWTPGGPAIFFGRMLQAGIVSRYLDDHCPDPRIRLCAHRDELPTSADEFFWGESVFNRLGRFQGMNDEMQTIVLESLVEYPWLQLEALLAATVEQLKLVATGYGVNSEVWHTYGIIERYAPAAAPAMRAARQQQGGLDFKAINRVHLPVAWASMIALVGLTAVACARARFADLGWLAATAAMAILVNAAVCGGLSNPHDRYGSRMAWLAPFVLLLVPGRRGAKVPSQSAKTGV